MNTLAQKIGGFLLLFCISARFVMAEGPQAQPANKAPENAQYLVAELYRCPAWVKVRADEQEFRAGITRLYLQFTAWDTKTLREGIERYLKENNGADPHADAKVFAFLRVIFAVPPGFVDGTNQYGGWGNPVRDGKVNLLWPYTLTNEGRQLVLSGEADKYFGTPYDGLAEFDELAAKYPRRGSVLAGK